MIIIIVLSVYIFAMIGIGVFYSGKVSNSREEYYLGGRGMGAFVTAVATGSTGRSAWLMLGMVGAGYIFGAGAIWAVAAYGLAEMFAMGFAGKRLRIFTEKMGNLTWPDYLETRFGDKTNILRISAVLIITMFYISYIGAQLKGSTKIFSFLFDVEPIYAIIFSAIIVMIYTMTGGYRAVMITSFIQGLIMVLSLVIMPIFLLLTHLDSDIIGVIMSTNPKLIDNPFGSASSGWILSQILIGLGSWGQVHMLTRYMSVKSPSSMKRAALGNGAWNVICAMGACLTGVFARVVWVNSTQLPQGDPELITAAIANSLMNPIVGGIIIAGVVSAIMSTIDQLLLTTTSTITKDFYQSIINKNINDRQVIKMSRIVMVICSIVAIFIALTDSQTIYWFVLFAFGGLGAAFGPIFILSVYWKKMTKWGAFMGMWTGLIVTVVWYNTPALKSIVYEVGPAFLLSLLVNILVSKLTAKDIPEHINDLFNTLNIDSDGK